MDILWILAHPDDESFGGAGAIIWASQRGLRTGLICATRGEVGEIADPSMGTPETLGAVREQELRRSMRLAGLNELRLMGHRDSGMVGTPPNNDPRALIQQPREETIAHLVAQIRELRPRTIVTFGPDGGYGHPDHIYIGDTTSEATLRAASDEQPFLGAPWQAEALYHVAIPREMFVALRSRPDGPFRDLSDEAVMQMGTPSSEITHWIDTVDYLDMARSVVVQHATQIPLPNPFTDPSSDRTQWLRWQQLRRIALPWDTSPLVRDTIDRLQDEHPNAARSVVGD